MTQFTPAFIVHGGAWDVPQNEVERHLAGYRSGLSQAAKGNLEMTKHWTRTEFIKSLDTTWKAYPVRLAQLSEDEQTRFAQQQGYAHSQDLLAHLGAWMEETRRVMPYLQRDERPPRDYTSDDDFNARAVQRFAERTYAEVATWYEQQRLALKQLVAQLPDEAFEIKRVYLWLFGTIVEHYDEHPLPERASK